MNLQWSYRRYIKASWLNESVERFPHKPYIKEEFPKNVTAVVNSTVTFKCPIVSDLEPYMQWLKVAEYPGDKEKSPKGILVQVQATRYSMVEVAPVYFSRWTLHLSQKSVVVVNYTT